MKSFALIFLVLNTLAFAAQSEPKSNCLLELPNRPMQGADFCTNLAGGKTLLNLCDGLYCIASTKYVRIVSEQICSDEGGLPIAGSGFVPTFAFPAKGDENIDVMKSGFGKALKEGVCKNLTLKKDCDAKCLEEICGEESVKKLLEKRSNSDFQSLFDHVQKEKANKPAFIFPSKEKSFAFDTFKKRLTNGYKTSEILRNGTLATGVRYIVMLQENSAKSFYDIKTDTWMAPEKVYPICK